MSQTIQENYKLGTSCFATVQDAIRYYKIYGIIDVKAKIAAGEINIGRPHVPEGFKLIINNEGRYVLKGLPTTQEWYEGD